jgi:hypothetical protein
VFILGTFFELILSNTLKKLRRRNTLKAYMSLQSETQKKVFVRVAPGVVLELKALQGAEPRERFGTISHL